MRKLGIGLALAALATWAAGCGGGHGGGRDASTAVCGDTVREDGEACDDGNDINGDGCDNNCTLTRCGNGIPTTATGEACDDGNDTNGDGCDRNCTVSACGNGIVAGDEECDDDTDACTDDCRRTCGNGQLEPNEQCDDGNTSDGDGCDTNCTFSACGNGIRAGAEACDDGNPIDDDGCDVNCQPSGCGNGVKSAREQCDDGNVLDDDGCDANCTFTACGNGVQGDGEVCDDGNVTNGDGCDANCTLSRCGNGALDETTEACDDGNDTPGDGCSPECAIERCGDGVTNTRTGLVAYALRFTSSTSAPYAVDVNGARVLTGEVQSGACDGAPESTTAVDDAARLAALRPTGNTLRVVGGGPGAIGRVYVVFTYDVDGDGTADVTDATLAIDGAGCADDDDCCVAIPSAGAAATGTFDLPVEGCDDGRDGDDYDGCTDACVVGTCGNGVDDDPDTAPAGVPLTGCEVDLDPACDLNCTKPRCGNGVVGLDEDGMVETCDDGNLVSGDGCSASCAIEPGFTCPGSGVSSPGDAGAPGPSGPGVLGGLCVAICGDGVDVADHDAAMQEVELCDDGNAVNGDACDDDCIPRGRCGDGVPNGYDDPATAQDEAEACDDGNAVDGDGCDTNCTLTGCGNGVRTAGEACDDGDRANDDGCDVRCHVNLCNDGIESIGELCFGLPSPRPLVFSARALAAARIDRGLSVDLATANGEDETFAVALNDGNGVFAAREYWVGFGADVADVALADFDGNGLVDVAVIDAAGGYVQVRYNAGNGTFAPGTSYAVGQDPTRLLATDLDGDGDPDLAAVNAGSNDVSVLLDLGTGGFAEAIVFPVPEGPRDLGAGDVDHDGDADLVVAGEAGRLQILPGNGTGSFAIGVGLDLGAEVGEIEIADLNRDGAADVVLGFTSGAAPLGVLLSNGHGSLELAGMVAHAGFDAPRALGLADLDGDGDADALALGDQGRVTILRNNGAGAFGAAITLFEAGEGATDLVATDLNGDSVTDLASVAGRAIEVMISTP